MSLHFTLILKHLQPYSISTSTVQAANTLFIKLYDRPDFEFDANWDIINIQDARAVCLYAQCRIENTSKNFQTGSGNLAAALRNRVDD